MRRLELKTCVVCDRKFAASKSQCPSCKTWHLDATPRLKGDDGTVTLASSDIIPQVQRVKTGPWDSNFGGGLVPGSAILLAGTPGAGKTTLSWQIVDEYLRSTNRDGLIVAAEQGMADVRVRAQDLNLRNANRMRFIPVRDGFNGDIGNTILARNPAILVVDSLSAMVAPQDAAEFGKRIKDYAVRLKAPAILIEHVTKEGDIAGTMDSQHEVDTTLILSLWDERAVTRCLLTRKNRLGVAPIETCLFMHSTGLVECPGCDYCDDEDEDS